MPESDLVITPTPEATKSGGKLTDSQRSARALIAVQGRPTSAICSATRRSPATIRNLIKNDPDIQARMMEYENRIVTTEALHRFEMLEYVGLAKQAILDGLGAPDLKLRVATGWEFIKHYTPKPAEQVDINLNIEGQIEVGKHLSAIAGSISKLAESGVTNESFKRRIRTELPGPTTLEPIEVTVEDMGQE